MAPDPHLSKNLDPDRQFSEGGSLPEPADQKTQEAASGDDTNSGG
jgi:hypothetical protein